MYRFTASSVFFWLCKVPTFLLTHAWGHAAGDTDMVTLCHHLDGLCRSHLMPIFTLGQKFFLQLIIARQETLLEF